MTIARHDIAATPHHGQPRSIKVTQSYRTAVAPFWRYNYGASAGGNTMFFTPVDRRVFLKGSAAAGLALPFAGVGSTQAREAELVARKVFFDNADCYNVRVSPGGKNLAWAAPVDKVINLFVAPVAD